MPTFRSARISRTRAVRARTSRVLRARSGDDLDEPSAAGRLDELALVVQVGSPGSVEGHAGAGAGAVYDGPAEAVGEVGPLLDVLRPGGRAVGDDALGDVVE